MQFAIRTGRGSSPSANIVTKATCEADGERVRTCGRCRKEEHEAIPAFGHSYGDWRTDAEGVAYRSCRTCGAKQTLAEFREQEALWQAAETETEPAAEAPAPETETALDIEG